MEQVDVSVILVNYNTESLLQPCLDRLALALATLRHQVFIVDNASRDASLRLLHERYSRYEIVENRVNVGFGRANNQVLGQVQGRYVLLLNTDAFIEPDAITKSIAYMQDDLQCGILGARLVDAQSAVRFADLFEPDAALRDKIAATLSRASFLEHRIQRCARIK